MIDVRVLELQALVDRQELQDQELQPTLDSLSRLLKDSNHKVCNEGCMVTATRPISNSVTTYAGEGVPKRYSGAACSHTAVQRSVSQLYRQLFPCLGELLSDRLML